MTKSRETAIQNIFKINLGVKKTDHVLVLTDGFNSDLKSIGTLMYETGKAYSDQMDYITFQPTGSHGSEPPEQVWRSAFGYHAVDSIKRKKLLTPLLTKKISGGNMDKIEHIIRNNRKDAVQAVIALSHYSTSHTRFRDMLTRICRTRYASMPLFDREMLYGAMMVNWKKMDEKTRSIARIVNRYDMIELESPNGTLLSFSTKGRKALPDTGLISRPGQFSNLPAGEVYLAPLEGTAAGTLVLEWAPTRKLKSPITIQVEKGLAKSLAGSDPYAKDLERKFSENRANRNIAELGIGTNDKARRPDNILESEKIMGTIHIAFGDNSSFGGAVSTSFHQDHVFFNTTLRLISKNGSKRILLEKGKLRI